MRKIFTIIFIVFATKSYAFHDGQSLICSYSERVEYRDLNNLQAYELSDEGIDTQLIVFKIIGQKLSLINSSSFSLIDPWGLQIYSLKKDFLVAVSENNFLRLRLNLDGKIVGYAGQITDQVISFPLSCISG